MPVIGYHDPQGTGLDHELLASDQFRKMSITIDTTARDTANTGHTTDLRRGLMMVPGTGLGGRYIQLALADAGSPDVVVLAENCFGIDAQNQVAEAYYAGDFKPNVLFDDSGLTLTHFTAANCQRISIRATGV